MLVTVVHRCVGIGCPIGSTYGTHTNGWHRLLDGRGGKVKGLTQGPAARQIVEPESITAHALKVECAVVVK